jgi:hypothetical protein
VGLNTDGFAKGVLGASCGGILRGENGESLYDFWKNENLAPFMIIIIIIIIMRF